jgi:hypothetical protein
MSFKLPSFPRGFTPRPEVAVVRSDLERNVADTEAWPLNQGIVGELWLYYNLVILWYIIIIINQGIMV